MPAYLKPRGLGNNSHSYAKIGGFRSGTNYIEAFCNTIKHRRLIKTDFRAEYGENARNESGLRFQEFTYKGNHFPQTWGSDILEKYRFHILQLITEVGLNINGFVAGS